MALQYLRTEIMNKHFLTILTWKLPKPLYTTQMGLSTVVLLSYRIYYVIEIIMLHRTTTISNNYKYSVLQQPKNWSFYP